MKPSLLPSSIANSFLLLFLLVASVWNFLPASATNGKLQYPMIRLGLSDSMIQLDDGLDDLMKELGLDALRTTARVVQTDYGQGPTALFIQFQPFIQLGDRVHNTLRPYILLFFKLELKIKKKKNNCLVSFS
jgi:hypothetical protein